MKARITSREARKLVGYRISEPHKTALSAVAEAYGAEVIFTEDAAAPLRTLLGDGEAPAAQQAEAPENECLLIAGFDRQALGEFVDSLRETGVRIPLKAVYTTHNCGWNFAELIGELKKEHEYMTKNGGGKK